MIRWPLSIGGHFDNSRVETRTIVTGWCNRRGRPHIDLVLRSSFGPGAEDPGAGDVRIRTRECLRGSGGRSVGHSLQSCRYDATVRRAIHGRRIIIRRHNEFHKRLRRQCHRYSRREHCLAASDAPLYHGESGRSWSNMVERVDRRDRSDVTVRLSEPVFG